MKFLHTADWHLGQTFHNRSRLPEQQRALDWLLDVLIEEEVDLLIVAGDIFDVSSPAEDARKLYYDFLGRLARTPVQWSIIVAGNHDNPRMISAARELARPLNIHIVGEPARGEDRMHDLIELRDGSGQLHGTVAAVPFLPDRYVRTSRADRSFEEQEMDLAEAILAHYTQLAEALTAEQRALPCLATGHLYATKAVAREGQDNIYVGNVRNLDAGLLPTAFDYVALGHIHRPQQLPAKVPCYYSGSLLALDFAETADEKGVHIGTFGNDKQVDLNWRTCPTNRRLKRLQGSPANLPRVMRAFAERHAQDELRPWIELSSTEPIPDEKQRRRLHELAAELELELLRLRVEHPSTPHGSGSLEEPALERLEELSVFDIYQRRCDLQDWTVELHERIDPLFRQAWTASEQGLAGAEGGQAAGS